MLETHMHLLTNAIVGATYAGTITGFEKEAKERAEAFRKAADAQVRTHASVEELRREVGAVKGEVAAMEQSLVERIGSLETKLIENLQSHSALRASREWWRTRDECWEIEPPRGH